MEVEIKEKPKLGCWWFVAIPVLLLMLFIAQMWGPNPAIKVGPKTTRITSPLGPNGLPDYMAHLHQQIRTGTTPENNAAVLYWRAMWPGELNPKEEGPLCQALGMPIPDPNESLTGIYDEAVTKTISDWLMQASASDEIVERIESELTHELIDRAVHRPWTSEQFPPLAEWAKNNQQPLDWLVAGAARPMYYSPSPSMVNKSNDGLILMLLPGVQMLRSAARSLIGRAMWHIGEGHPMDAWRDLLACHRISRHTSQGCTLVEQLVAIAIDSMAAQGTQTLLHHGNLTTADAQQILRDLQALPNLPTMTQAMNQGERMMFLDSVMRMATGKAGLNEFRNITSGGDDVTTLLLGTTRRNWNIVLEEGNKWYDRMVETSRLPRAQRLVAMDEFDSDIQNIDPRHHPAMIVGSLVSTNARSMLTADLLMMLFLPAVNAATEATDRGSVVSDLTQVCAALAVYRTEHGNYPDSLEQLVPRIVAKLPLDLYSGKPFIYEKQGEGYVLYSVYRNGVDDGADDLGGHIVKGEWVTEGSGVSLDASDLVVLVPRQEFELFPLTINGK